jgi:hypothetical protein
MRLRIILVNGGLDMIEIDGHYINLRNVLFACPEDQYKCKIAFVDGTAIIVNVEYKTVKLVMLKFYR